MRHGKVFPLTQVRASLGDAACHAESSGNKMPFLPPNVAISATQYVDLVLSAVRSDPRFVISRNARGELLKLAPDTRDTRGLAHHPPYQENTEVVQEERVVRSKTKKKDVVMKEVEESEDRSPKEERVVRSKTKKDVVKEVEQSEDNNLSAMFDRPFLARPARKAAREPEGEPVDEEAEQAWAHLDLVVGNPLPSPLALPKGTGSCSLLAAVRAEQDAWTAHAARWKKQCSQMVRAVRAAFPGQSVRLRPFGSVASGLVIQVEFDGFLWCKWRRLPELFLSRSLALSRSTVSPSLALSRSLSLSLSLLLSLSLSLLLSLSFLSLFLSHMRCVTPLCDPSM
jgi:hypothetical protein